ncbi:glycerol-3-phosphate 1-O-acyltransferase PlsY [Marinitoga litoralis]|uniref:glycerol-3-phosphate 1-O-acyltransferase PlsY n=1 Tax=Marinitoga litoralis TaxID=570855 RepID=UPI00195F5B84|nr:glycerol-3-phosphate 1-O-acyltransferase PlsY [Marinitoga litoralis]MBM7559467.1 glycerol-3-phosphate acyltransferase PlsY [Marinitoga litoralis]
MYLYLILSYLIGSIPFSFIIPYILTGRDVRKYGSNNVGTSNAVYTTNLKVGILCLIGDFSKGFFSYYLFSQILNADNLYVSLASLLAVIGHNWSIFLKFKGGKGIATLWGILMAYNPIVGLSFAAISALITFISKYIALGNVLSLLIITIISYFNIFNIDPLLLTIMFIIILPKHIENLVRIVKGQEIKVTERLDN